MVSTSRRRRGPPRAFSPDEVLDVAQELLDAGGPEAASIRGIAKRLGVAPNTIYTYYSDKAAIMEALVERLLGSVDHGVFADPSEPWQRRVEALALELREQLTAHPEAVGLIVSDPMSGPHALALNEGIRRLFTDIGLTATDAARSARVLVVYILGSLALEIAHPENRELPPPRHRAGATPQASIDTAEGPVLRDPSAPTGSASGTSTEQYLWGLHKVLDGLTRRGATI